MNFQEWLEPFLPVLKEKGYEFVIVYRHEKDEALKFYDSYKSFYDSTQMRKYWQKHGYVISRVYDLDYGDGMSQRERNRVRPRNRSTIE